MGQLLYVFLAFLFLEKTLCSTLRFWIPVRPQDTDHSQQLPHDHPGDGISRISCRQIQVKLGRSRIEIIMQIFLTVVCISQKGPYMFFCEANAGTVSWKPNLPLCVHQRGVWLNITFLLYSSPSFWATDLTERPLQEVKLWKLGQYVCRSTVRGKYQRLTHHPAIRAHALVIYRT